MPPRMTGSTRKVLEVLIAARGESVYGLEIGKEAGLASGTLYPILDRLSREGWLEPSWEDIDPAREGRPRRRYYRLTADGDVAAVRALQKRRPARNRLRLAIAPEGR